LPLGLGVKLGMSKITQEKIDLKPIFMIGWLVLTVLATSILVMLVVPNYLLKMFFAIVTLTLALALPIHQKHISLYTVFLLISSILFLVSGVIEQAYETIVNPLPVLSQIEFSRTMRPQQISRGLGNIGIGIIYILLSVAGLFSKKISQRMKWLLLLMCGMAMLFMLLGRSSIIGGLSRL
jgi:hypothetical protein